MTLKETLKKVGKISLSALFWIFILSIRFEGKTLFSHANEYIVQKSFLKVVDGLSDLWYTFSDTARITFSDNPHDTQDMPQKRNNKG